MRHLHQEFDRVRARALLSIESVTVRQMGVGVLRAAHEAVGIQ